MKKFLTVLLALSVVFTYTVGTAFAVSTDELNTATSYADNMITSVANSTRASQNAAGIYDSTAIENAIADTTKIGTQLTNDLITLNTKTDGSLDMAAFRADINEWCGVTGVQGSHINGSNVAYANTSFAAYFNAAIVDYDKDAKVSAAIAKVNATKAKSGEYTDQLTVNIGGTTYTHQQAVEIYCDKALDLLEKLTVADYAAQVPTILYGAANLTEDTATGGLYGADLKGLTTVAQYEEQNANAIIDVDHAIAELTYFAKRAYYDANKVDAADNVALRLDNDGKLYGVKPATAAKVTADEAAQMNANLKSDLEDTLAVLAVYFNNLTNKSVTNLTALVNGLEANTGTSTTPAYTAFNAAITQALAAKDMYEKVVAYGNDMKDEVTFTGDKKYSDADIDEAVADAKDEIYGKYAGGYSTVTSSYFTDVVAINDPVAVAIAEATDKWQAKIIYAGANKTGEADKKYCRDYYDQTYFGSDYDDIKAATLDALNDAKTVDEVNTIMADADKDLADLRTKAEYDALDKTENVNYQKALNSYAQNVMKTLMGTTDYRAASFTAVVKKYAGASTSRFDTPANAGKLEYARTLDEVKALYEEGKAEIDKILTEKQLNEEAAKVQTLIAALPTNASMDKEADFTAAYDAYKSYLDNYGAASNDVKGSTVFVSKMADLKNMQIKAVEDAIAAMDDDNVITRDELTAVENLYDKYVEYYGQYDEAFAVGKNAEAALAAAQTKVWNDEVAAVKKLIAKLTSNSSSEELAAAKAAYDALTGSQQRAVYEAYPYKVQLLETKIIESVEALKITASSTAKKGSITVKWTVKGDSSVADGFQVYRSLKMNSGFGTKAFFTTTDNTKRTYKNTKSLKKGTRYYYKIRAYKVVDGVKYYSDWSNKAYRIAK